MLNLVSSPGAGKTTLLPRSIGDLKDRFTICVIEGDQQTSRDAERVAATGIQVVQINTGKACHLDAQMVGRALEDLNLENWRHSVCRKCGKSCLSGRFRPWRREKSRDDFGNRG